MNCEDAKICSSCLDIYGFIRTDQAVYYQKCNPKCPNGNKMDMPSDEKEQLPWKGFDYNEIVTLCHCCGTELLRSGSRWSVWFCEPCKERVVTLNAEAGVAVIPIGRHSLMNGIGIEGKPSISKKEIKAMAGSLNNMGSRIDCLEEWRKMAKSRNWQFAGLDPGQDAGLIKYLCLVESIDKEDAFIRMREFFLK